LNPLLSFHAIIKQFDLELWGFLFLSYHIFSSDSVDVSLGHRRVLFIFFIFLVFTYIYSIVRDQIYTGCIYVYITSKCAFSVSTCMIASILET
jgi:hypothetical protein